VVAIDFCWLDSDSVEVAWFLGATTALTVVYGMTG